MLYARVKVLSLVILMLGSIVPAHSEEVSAFATTSPDMSSTALFNRQLSWQLKHPDKQSIAACLQNKVQPWFAHKSSFYYQRYKKISKIISVETLKFKNKVNLSILNAGCESYTVFFRLEFRMHLDEFNLIKGPYVRALQALQLINTHSKKRIFNINKAIQQISALIKRNDIPNYGEWIRVKGDGVKSAQAEFAILKTGIILQQGKPVLNTKYGFVEFALSRGLPQTR